MIDPNQERLKSLLLQLAEEQSKQSAADNVWEQTFERLMQTRFEVEEIGMSAAVQADGFDRLHEALRERKTSNSKSPTNGKALSALDALLHPRRVTSGRRVWLGFAVGIALLGMVWYALDLPGAPGLKNWMAGGPRLEKQSPKLSPELPGPRAPTQENRQEPREPKGGGSSPERAAPKTGPRRTEPKSVNPPVPPIRVPTEGLLAQRGKVGEFTAVTGEPKVVGLRGEKPVAALPKSAVYAGVRIETGDADKAEIRFSDGTTVALNFNTSIVTSSLSEDQSKQPERTRLDRIKLTSGKVWTVAAKRLTGDPFSIETPVATATVLGTEFGVELRNKGTFQEAIVQVKEGRVRFFNKLGAVEATSMTESRASANSAPTPLKRLSSLKTFALGGNAVEVVVATAPAFPGAAERLAYNWGWVGLDIRNVEVGGQPSSSAPKFEARITRVVRNSPATRAGFRVGDVLTQIDSHRLNRAQEAEWIVFVHAGEPLLFHGLREGKEFHLQVRPIRPYWAPSPPLPSGALKERLRKASELLIEGAPRTAEQIFAKLLTENIGLAAVHNNLGLLYESKDDLDKAIRHYQNAVAISPNVALYRFNLGMALRSIGNFERAEEELSAAARLAPAWGFPKDELAGVLMILGRFDEAGQVLRTWTTLEPHSADAWLAIAQYFRRAQEPEKAFAATKRALELEPEYPNALRAFGEVHPDPIEAERLLVKAAAMDPTDHRTLESLGNLLIDLGRYEEAEKTILRAIEMDPDHSTLHSNLGYLYRVSRKYAQAEISYLKAIHLDPNDSVALSNLAALYIMHLNKPKEAEQLLLRVIAMEPGLVGPYQNLGFLYQKLGRFEEAERTFLKIIELDPTYDEALFSLGELYIDMKKPDESENALLRALKLQPDKEKIHRELGYLYYVVRKEPLRAEPYYRRAIVLDPKNPSSFNNLGQILMESGRLDEAYEMLRKAIEVNPKHGPAYNNLGTLHGRRGQVNEAENMYRKAVELDPANSVALSNLGFLYYKLERYAEAEPIWRGLLELNPQVANFYLNLAGAIAEQGVRLDEALALAHKGMELAKTPAEIGNAHGTLGVVLLNRGELEKAEAALKMALEAAPNSAVRWRNLGRVHEKMGRRAEAIESYRKALSFDPKDSRSQAGLKRLGG